MYIALETDSKLVQEDVVLRGSTVQEGSRMMQDCKCDRSENKLCLKDEQLKKVKKPQE